ncbi:heme oxygenase [Variibacter gotjawalensis]|uniref:Heme oxygenase n=1 Tax=Variibacter gotjawalensis TaxID=1333996 RepID=A0A0S3PT74_9BRAD|nr:biliverdin-producing heme oxygenase [Variibacter gotjawalensis]NIK49399.1 heme oxygenase [Variibacter gotjawalensis]RZS51251.1 heme oxygenase [Variibacter gotjawalensis]BAT59084.1 heme oxygenase [Variibacter gotjawalensis]
MVRSPLHLRLRESTAAAHEHLENLVGELTDLAAYKRYLSGIYAFRQPIEVAWADSGWPPRFGGWRPTMIASAMDRDLADLGLARPRPEQPHLDTDFAARLGTLYVLEGSSLGAKLLLRNVRMLGLAEDFGARHLSLQANADTWRSYLRLLEQDDEADPDAVIAAANETFAVAARAFTD